MVTRRALLLFIALANCCPAAAETTTTGSVERFAGETRIGAQPPLPIHLELRTSGARVTGTISIPGTTFELVDARLGNPIIGRFEADGVGGTVSLRIDGDALAGEFELGGQDGAITARRTVLHASDFFRPPEQRLDLTPSEWLEDLDRLTAILETEHASPFHRIARVTLHLETERVRRLIPNLKGADIAIEFARLAALIGDGHTKVEMPRGRPRLPIEFFVFDDGIRVVASKHTRALGARLVSLGEVPALDLSTRMRAFVAQGETEEFYRAQLPALLNDPAVLKAVGVKAGASWSAILELADGGKAQVEIQAASTAGEGVAVLGGRTPIWKSEAEKGFWKRDLADGSLYVNWRSYEGVAKEFAALLKDIDARRPRRIILDLRDNRGGDYEIGRGFIEEIRSRPWLDKHGVLYVLIGRDTFSAAMTNATDFKLKTNAILVGEPAGAAPNNWQEVRRFPLPNSGLRVGVSTVYAEFLPGEDKLRPDDVLPPRPSDWGADVDNAIGFIMAQPFAAQD